MGGIIVTAWGKEEKTVYIFDVAEIAKMIPTKLENHHFKDGTSLYLDAAPNFSKKESLNAFWDYKEKNGKVRNTNLSDFLQLFLSLLLQPPYL